MIPQLYSLAVASFSYRHQPRGWKEKHDDGHTTDSPLAPLTSNKIPRTQQKHKTLILKARSKLECDAWCWALNSELERVVRATGEKQEKLVSGV